MAVKVIVPSEGGDACIVSECAVSTGDHVNAGDLICSVETDKAMIDVTAPCEGVILELFCKENEEVQAFGPVAIIGQGGEAEGREKVKASPRARRYAAEHGVSLEGISGTGFSGSITEQDVKAAEPDKTDTAEIPNYRVRKLSRMEQASGSHVLASLKESAQFTITSRVCVDKLLELRRRFQESGERFKLQSVTVNDLFCFAAAKTLPGFQRINAVWHGEELREYSRVNLGIAVDSGEGLLVPVIQNAQELSLEEFAKRSHELAAKCRQHSQSSQDLSGGTFSVTNLGSYGIESFTPIINTPQVAILGIGGPVGRLVLENGQLREIQEVMLSLTLDHRVVDGAPGAQFLKELRENIENIDILLGK